MQKGYINASSEGHKTTKRILLFALVPAIIASLLAVYWLILDPLVIAFLKTPTEYKEIETYTNEEYVDFYEGIAFQEYLNTIEFINNENCIQFYYRDNRTFDNPIYGKVWDVYAVDFQLDDQTYLDCKERYNIEENYEGSYKDYEVFCTNSKSNDKNETAIAFNDTNNVVRCIMVTDVEYGDFNLDLYGILLRWSNIP